MNQESLATLDRIIQEASLELFAAYQVQLDEGSADGGSADDAYAATLGFTHTVIKGALIITVCRDLVIHSLPRQITVPDAGMVADWTGELANQLMGRIKKKFFNYGLDVTLSTPVVFGGRGLNRFPRQTAVCRTCCFGHGTGQLEVVFQADVGNGFEFVESALAGSVMTEGDVALF